ncbi:uncharacterized protein LOC107980677 [Nasonia vitripennis]|uniref:C2H2-type domain-containing protein n=1 Tax=Nasonia vitripennis TaxID=7425 RepID=A0A7M7QAB4_NASVI|nr:uncharacterized protein LOC107980677 [Nasonia vitripennis]
MYHSINVTKGIPDTGFICGQNGCQSNFVHFRNLRRHILNNHLAEANLATAAADDEVNAVEMNENMEYDNNDILEHHEMEAEAFNNMARDIVNAPLDLRSYIVKMIYEINAQLVQHLVNKEIIRDVNKVFDNENPFLDLKTFEQQMKALNENSDYIDPIEIPLGRRVDSRLNKTTLSNQEVRLIIDNEQPSSDGSLESFIDGDHFKNHVFFQKYKKALRLKLYYDEKELVGPLDSKTGVHKVGVFYYQISNLPAHMNSALNSIHVLIVAHHVDVQKYGFEKILSPFMKELAQLESDAGITLKFGDENFILRASIESFCGDALALHDVFN